MNDYRNGRPHAGGRHSEEPNAGGDDPRSRERSVDFSDAHADAEHLIEAWTYAPEDLPGGAYVELCLLVASKGDWSPRAGDIYRHLSDNEAERYGITNIPSTRALSIEEGAPYRPGLGQGRASYSIPYIGFQRTFSRVATWHESPARMVRKMMEATLPDREEIPDVVKMQQEIRGYLQEQYADELADALESHARDRSVKSATEKAAETSEPSASTSSSAPTSTASPPQLRPRLSPRLHLHLRLRLRLHLRSPVGLWATAPALIIIIRSQVKDLRPHLYLPRV